METLRTAFHFIVVIVEAMLRRGSDNNEILVVPVRIEVLDPHAVKSGDRQRTFVFLFHRPSNYTKVMVASENYRRENEFEIVSNHDSCWRSDGVEDQLHGKFKELTGDRFYRGEVEIVPTTVPHVVTVKNCYYVPHSDNRKFYIEW